MKQDHLAKRVSHTIIDDVQPDEAEHIAVHPFFQPGSSASASSIGQVVPSPPSLYHYVSHDPLAGSSTAAPRPSSGLDHRASTTLAASISPRKVAISFYDLDGTLIKPKSGAKWPKNKEDWAWWHVSVPAKLKQEVEAGRHVVVISNQGSGQEKTIQEWKGKIPLIAAKVSWPYILFVRDS